MQSVPVLLPGVHKIETLKIKDMENLRINALALHLGLDVEDLEVSSYDEKVIGIGSQEYLVVTDSEADELWDEDLENYIDDCLEIPESIKPYFDREAWKSDARHDGRAHSLSGYDGNEDEITVYEYTPYFDSSLDNVYHDNEDQYNDTDEYVLTGEKETFYIYRQN